MDEQTLRFFQERAAALAAPVRERLRGLSRRVQAELAVPAQLDRRRATWDRLHADPVLAQLDAELDRYRDVF